MQSLPVSWTRKKIISLAICVEGGLILVAFLAGWILGVSPWGEIRTGARDIGIGFLAVLPMIFSMYIILRLPIDGFREINRLVQFFIDLTMRRVRHYDLIIISILAGAGEEFLFRGTVQSAAIDYLGVLPGVVVASLLFGCAHFITIHYAFLAAFMGAYLGWLCIVTGNLLVPVICHAAYDYIAFRYFLGKSKRAFPICSPQD